MPPQRSEIEYALVFKSVLIRLYGDVTTAARRKRLTEHDLAQIERTVLGLAGKPDQFGTSAADGDARKAFTTAIEEITQILLDARDARIREITTNP